jgi:hypothetical protein
LQLELLALGLQPVRGLQPLALMVEGPLLPIEGGGLPLQRTAHELQLCIGRCSRLLRRRHARLRLSPRRAARLHPGDRRHPHRCHGCLRLLRQGEEGGGDPLVRIRRQGIPWVDARLEERALQLLVQLVLRHEARDTQLGRAQGVSHQLEWRCAAQPSGELHVLAQAVEEVERVSGGAGLVPDDHARLDRSTARCKTRRAARLARRPKL